MRGPRVGPALLALALLGGGARAADAPAAGADPAGAFAAEARAWRDHYNKRTSQIQLLSVALKDDKAALEAAKGRYDSAARMHQTQLKLYKSLVRNQEEALKDGVITQEVLDKHLSRLNRMMDERLYFLWGHSLAAGWNESLAKLPKARRPSFYPLPVRPSQEEWDRFRLRDYTPFYEKTEKRMKTVKPEDIEPAEGAGAK